MQNFNSEFDTSPIEGFKTEFNNSSSDFDAEFNSSSTDFKSEFDTSSVDFDAEFNTSPIEDFNSEFECVVTSPLREEKQEKSVVITENGTTVVLPDENKVLSKVTVVADIIGGNVEEYKGSYEVTPRLQEQTLPTARKVMRDDVKINKIPITTVSNSSGGNTVIIGG